MPLQIFFYINGVCQQKPQVLLELFE